MFTSRFAFLALLTFLARANAGCATCDDTVEVDGVAIYTLANSTVEYNGYLLCTYVTHFFINQSESLMNRWQLY